MCVCVFVCVHLRLCICVCMYARVFACLCVTTSFRSKNGCFSVQAQ